MKSWPGWRARSRRLADATTLRRSSSSWKPSRSSLLMYQKRLATGIQRKRHLFAVAEHHHGNATSRSYLVQSIRQEVRFAQQIGAAVKRDHDVAGLHAGALGHVGR